MRDHSLDEFLREEVLNRIYADLLLERADAAGAGNDAPAASGNTYYVTFSADEVVIQHLYLLEERPIFRLSRQAFIAALTAWRETLAG